MTRLTRLTRLRGPIALALLVAAGAACSGAEDRGGTLARIGARGEITWGADIQGGEPFVYEDPANPKRLIGFEVDIMDGIARRLGVKARMVQYTWSNLVPSLERGDFDVVMNGLEATDERKRRILLSEPYYIYAETLTIRAGDPYRSVFDLTGKRVGTLNQTYAHDILRMLPVEAVLYEGNEEPYRDLELGRTDAVLLDNIIADRYGCIPTKPTLRCVPYDVARGTYAIGIRKDDPELKAAIDDALAAMRRDGELQRILEKARLWDHRQTDVVPAESVAARRRQLDAGLVAQFLEAAVVTLKLSVLSFLLAVPLGALLAVARVYGAAPARACARIYVEVFRGTPVLLQLFVLYYGLGDLVSLGPVQAAVLGLGLNYAAYESEVYRGALLAIPRGQSEAARALGLGPWQTLRHVMLPQALRHALPAMTNDFVALLKDSSLVNTITVIELTKRTTIAAVDLGGYLIPGLLCAALYLAMSLPLSELARRLERRLARDQRPLAV
ncbi:MAG TPA: ABC transporter substrate-binding protein/permease [Kofleriaceae bacterium]|nr:ABC transporter substrate-binding protein/permease [Kofleriaceae bacterium]